MNSHQKNLGSRVGLVTLASMLASLLGMSLLLVVTDARAASPGFPIVPVDSVDSDLQSARLGQIDDTGATDMDWQEVSHLPVVTGMSQAPDSGTKVFVYTRNADGILTDPD